MNKTTLISLAAVLEAIALCLIVGVLGRHIAPFTDEKVVINGPVVLPLILFVAAPWGMLTWALFPKPAPARVASK